MGNRRSHGVTNSTDDDRRQAWRAITDLKSYSSLPVDASERLSEKPAAAAGHDPGRSLASRSRANRVRGLGLARLTRRPVLRGYFLRARQRRNPLLAAEQFCRLGRFDRPASRNG